MGIHKHSGDIGNEHFSLQHLLWTVLQVFVFLGVQTQSTRGSIESKIPCSSGQVDTAIGACKKHHGNNTEAQNGFKMHSV